MELSIEKLRIKQKKQFQLRAIGIFAFGILSIVIALLIINKDTDSETQIENSTQEIASHTICLDLNLPTELSEKIANIDAHKLTETNQDEIEFKYKISNDEDICNTLISRNILDDSGYDPIWSKVYIPIARIDSQTKEFTLNSLDSAIASQTIDTSEGENSQYLIWDIDETDKFIKTKFSSTSGQAYPSLDSVLTDTIANTAFIAIIPFESLTPEYKVITIDGTSPLQKEFNKTTYPLTDSYWIKSDYSEFSVDLQTKIQEILGDENYNSNELYDVIITGNSSIGARSQYLQLLSSDTNINDPTYPIRGIADTLRSASIAHLNNENSFAETCTQNSSTFDLCGKPDSIQQLTYAGIDIVGLTGESIMDAGRKSFEQTLEFYKANDIKYFAGGYNYEEAHTAEIIKLGDLKVAFLGYNFIPPYSYGATKNSSGNSQYTTAIMQADMEKAKYELKADFLFVDMQWSTELSKFTTQAQITNAKNTLAAGADIITGLNPIYTQGYDHYGDKVVFYALGNTMFEPYNEESRSAIMVRHLFHQDKYLGFELIPTYINTDFQTVLAEDERKDTIIKEVSKKSNLYYINSNN
jgi:hypothetical protein